jgi:hypothetical protein
MTDELEEELLEDLHEWDDFPDDFFREKDFSDIEYRTYVIGPVDIEDV